MFEELFTEPRTIERYQSAPLAEQRQLYLRYGRSGNRAVLEE